MASIAAFAQSDRGRIFAAVSERFPAWDPGASFPDDVVAYNFRAALLLASNRAQEDDGPVMERNEHGTHVSGLNPLEGL